MRVVRTSQGRRRDCTDVIMSGIMKVSEWIIVLFVFKPVVWFISHTYDKVYEKICPTSQMARTPYHGKFHCPSCGRTWSSVRSWPNVSQQCKNCLNQVQSYEQRPLRPWDKLVSFLSSLRTTRTFYLVLIIFVVLVGMVLQYLDEN